VEWFKLTKQRAAVRPQVAAETTVPAPVPPTQVDSIPDAVISGAKISSLKIPSPKTIFDHPASEKPVIRPAAKVGFTISSSKDGESSELQLTSPTLTVAKARMLFKSGWRVHITNAAGRKFAPSEFDEVLKFD
jgi:hypothetical protein